MSSKIEVMPVERIENLPAGTRLFLDANIFVYAFLGHSNQCRELLGRCATEQVLGITSLDVVNEVTHRMRRLFLACCLVTLLAGCGDKAKDLYETAQLEEKQFNKPHATELYRQIVRAISQFTLREPSKESFGRAGEVLIREA